MYNCRRGIRGLKRGAYRGASRDRNQFVKLAPLSEENKTQIQEAMNKRYVPGNKALDLTNFGADATFGGSSGATGKLTDERVMDVVTETIGQHLADLEALSLTNNSLRTLRGKIFLIYNALQFNLNIPSKLLQFRNLTQGCWNKGVYPPPTFPKISPKFLQNRVFCSKFLLFAPPFGPCPPPPLVGKFQQPREGLKN